MEARSKQHRWLGRALRASEDHGDSSAPPTTFWLRPPF